MPPHDCTKDSGKEMKKTHHTVKTIEMEEFFSDEDGKIYWNYRFGGEDAWRKELTPFKEFPFATFPKVEVAPDTETKK